MTTDQFRSEYHLLDRVSTGPVETYHAQAAAGAMVMVHFLHGDDADNRRILDCVERLRPEPRQKVLKIVDVEGSTVVVTRFILDLDSFVDWLVAGAEPDATPPSEIDTQPDVAQPDVAADDGAAGPGEFTRMFAAMAPEAPPSDQPAPPIEAPPEDASLPPRELPPPESPPREPQRPDADAPGEFTRMFGSPAPPAEPAPAEHPAPRAEPPAGTPVAPAAEPRDTMAAEPPKPEPGEFTRMFAAQALPQPHPPRPQPQPPVPQAPPPAAPTGPSLDASPAGPIEQPPIQQPPIQSTRPPAQPPRPAPPPASAAGEFTAMFGAPARPADMPEPLPAPPPSAPRPAQQPPSPAAPPAYPTPPVPKPSPQPGEYTKMFGAAGSQPSPPAQPAPVRDVGASDDYLNRLSGGGHSPAQQAPLRPAPLAGPHQTPPPMVGPSEFTRVISAMPGTPLSGQPPSVPPSLRTPPPTPMPASAPTSGKWLAIGIAAVVFAALLFVVLVVVIGR